MAKLKMRTFKEIREDIENLPAITKKETFLTAIPLLVELTTKIAKMRKTIKTCAEAATLLNDACTKYALAHVDHVFVNGLVTDGKGVKHGDVDVNGVTYHFSAGFGKLVRTDGDNMTQDFLDGLPEKWKKGKLELDQTAIARLGVTAEELEAAGLVKSANNVWSLPEAAGDGE